MEINAISVLLFGFFLGVKHSLDADHIVAVSTIVGRRKGFWSSSLVGAAWGIGHTASLLVIGLLVIVFHFQLPDKIALITEFCVALMLIVLGGNVLWKIRKGETLHVHTHEHNHHLHIHPHIHERAQENIHNHTLSDVGKKPFIIGMVHGLAGSAGLMLIVLATISSRALAIMYIAVFGIGSVGGMFLMSAMIGLPFSLTVQHERLHRVVQLTSGVVSICFGLFYAWQVSVAGGMF